MPDPLVTIWERSDAEEARFTGDEIFSLGDTVLDLLTQAGLIRRIENLQSVCCDACAEDHVEEITYIESPAGSPIRAYIHCPENGRISVPLDRLKQWEVDFEGLAKDVTSSLDLAGKIEEVSSGRIWFLGKTTIAGRSREVFLARGMTWADAHEIVGSSVQLNASREPVVFVPGRPPPEEIWNGDSPPVVQLKVVAALEKSQLIIDRDHLESLLSSGRRRAAPAPAKSFPTPAGARWSDVRIFATDFGISVEAKGKSRKYTFSEAGFEEKRRKGAVPDRLWTLLQLFAKRGGTLPPNDNILDRKTRTNLKQYVTELRKRISAFIPNIEGDPVVFDKDERCYKTAFRISSGETTQFPTPPGTTWPNVEIKPVGPLAIIVSVVAKETFAASAYDEQSGEGVHRWEPAEREATVEHEYDLQMLGLVDERGQPDHRGQALLDLLDAEGTILRKSDDKGVLELGGFLCKLMGINSPPFDFAPYEEKWVALFEASRE